MHRAIMVALAFGLAADRALAADSCSGGCPKLPSNMRAVSATGMTVAAFPNMMLSATLKEGSAKRILVVDGLLTEGHNTPTLHPRLFALGIDVNGLPMQPSSSPDDRDVLEDCGLFRPAYLDGACTVSGHWWADLDDPANAALIGAPLTVTLVGGFLGGNPIVAMNMSLTVRLEKK